VLVYTFSHVEITPCLYFLLQPPSLSLLCPQPPWPLLSIPRTLNNFPYQSADRAYHLMLQHTLLFFIQLTTSPNRPSSVSIIHVYSALNWFGWIEWNVLGPTASTVFSLLIPHQSIISFFLSSSLSLYLSLTLSLSLLCHFCIQRNTVFVEKIEVKKRI
jgi:hypothetical protein